jgi:hypothetical protein
VVADRERARALPQNVLADLIARARRGPPDGNFRRTTRYRDDAEAARATTITGSYNFTIAAQRQYGECVVLRDNGRRPRTAQLVAAQGERDAVGRCCESIIISDVIPAKAGIQLGFQCQINLIGPRPAPGRRVNPSREFIRAGTEKWRQDRCAKIHR